MKNMLAIFLLFWCYKYEFSEKKLYASTNCLHYYIHFIFSFSYRETQLLPFANFLIYFYCIIVTGVVKLASVNEYIKHFRLTHHMNLNKTPFKLKKRKKSSILCQVKLTESESPGRQIRNHLQYLIHAVFSMEYGAEYFRTRNGIWLSWWNTWLFYFLIQRLHNILLSFTYCVSKSVSSFLYQNIPS